MEVVLKLIESYPILGTVLSVLGSLVVASSIIVPLTPTKKDDEILDKIKSNSIAAKAFDFMERFSLFKRSK